MFLNLFIWMHHDEGADSKVVRRAPDTRIQEQYRTIGQALSNLEASSPRVGIPWLAPTPQVRAWRTRIDPSVAEFFRLQVVTVSTGTLESYADDLENLATDTSKQPLAEIHLIDPTPIERYAFTAVTFLVCFVMTVLSILLSVPSFPLALLVGVLIACPLSSVAYTLSSDNLRFCSFHQVVMKEINARKGIDGNTTKLRFGTPQASPS